MDCRVGEVTECRVGERAWSMLALLAWLAFVARRAVRGGDMGAGCGRSRGLRLLNLYEPYVASLFDRAAAAGEEVGAAGRLTGS